MPKKLFEILSKIQTVSKKTGCNLGIISKNRLFIETGNFSGHFIPTVFINNTIIYAKKNIIGIPVFAGGVVNTFGSRRYRVHERRRRDVCHGIQGD